MDTIYTMSDNEWYRIKCDKVWLIYDEVGRGLKFSERNIWSWGNISQGFEQDAAVPFQIYNFKSNIKQDPSVTFDRFNGICLPQILDQLIWNKY